MASASNVRNAIRGYIYHHLDAAYARVVFDLAELPVIGSVLEDMLGQGERHDVRDALLFIEDAIRFGMHVDFAAWYQHSSLLQAVQNQLCGADYFSRHAAAYTLARAGPRSNARVLAQAFPWYLAHDPLELQGLLSQLSLFGRPFRSPTYVTTMAMHPLYLTRWAAVEMLSEWRFGMLTGRRFSDREARQLVRLLAQDRHPRVRAEARWRLDEWRSVRRSSVPRWRRAALAERQRRGEPYPSFFVMQLNVSNYLAISGQADYDVPLVEAIIAYISTHPIAPGYDPHAYWQAFQASHTAR